MREMGISLATAISAWINCFLLYFILKIKGNIYFDFRLIRNGYRIIICSILMACVCYLLNHGLFLNLTTQSNIFNIGALILTLLLCKIIYIVMIFVLKVLTFDELKGYLRNKS